MPEGVANTIIRLLNMPGRVMRGVAAFAARLHDKGARITHPRQTTRARRSPVARRDPRDAGVRPHARRQGTSS